jgi:hypothetical protein
MCKISVLWLVGFVFVRAASAQVGDAGIRSASFGGAGSAVLDRHWSLLNPASVGNVDAMNVSLFGTQGYGFTELRFARTTIAMPAKGHGIGLDISTFGHDEFRFIDAGLTVARPVLPSFGTYLVGARASYRSIGVEGFDRASVAILDIGWIAAIRPGLSLGGTIGNLLESRFSDVDRLPRLMRIGAAIEPRPGLLLVADLSKEDRWPTSTHFGVEFAALPALALRAGSATNPERLSTGARMSIGDLVIDLLADRHIDLGWTPGLGVSVSW